MIETERLRIQPFCEDDLDIIFQLYSDEEIMKYMPNDYMNQEAAAKHLAKILQAWKEVSLTDCEMLVFAKHSSEKIGRCRIHLDQETDSAMIGWLLLKKEWGKGYATEITNALLDHAFDTLHVRRVCALCHPDNTASWRVLEKCGMRREAHYKEKCRYIKHGKVSWQDELEYAILKTER